MILKREFSCLLGVKTLGMKKPKVSILMVHEVSTEQPSSLNEIMVTLLLLSA